MANTKKDFKYGNAAKMFKYIRPMASGVQRGRGRTGRRPRASTAGGHPESEITKFKCCK